MPSLKVTCCCRVAAEVPLELAREPAREEGRVERPRVVNQPWSVPCTSWTVSQAVQANFTSLMKAVVALTASVRGMEAGSTSASAMGEL